MKIAEEPKKPDGPLEAKKETPEVAKSMKSEKNKKTTDVAKSEKAPENAEKPKKKRILRDVLGEGTTVKSVNNQWKISCLLGRGGFGDVYKATGIDSPKEYAIKTEQLDGKKSLLRLKVEVSVMLECSLAIKKGQKYRHFVELVDRGRNNKFKWVVMSLLGPSLEDIRKRYLMGAAFSQSTVMQTAAQALQSIIDLHEVGYLHRDIKPQNFTVGFGADQTTVYCIDFGICRRIYEKGTKNLKVPRASVKFLGTLRFACRAAHYFVEQSRKDDIECWLYFVYDLFDQQKGLPWKNMKKGKEIADSKAYFFRKTNLDYCSKIPSTMFRIHKYVAGLRFSDNPDYHYVMTTLLAVAKDSRIDIMKPLDWIGKLDKPPGAASKEDHSSGGRPTGSDSGSKKSEMKPVKSPAVNGSAEPPLKAAVAIKC